jgi:hypothetical protein
MGRGGGVCLSMSAFDSTYTPAQDSSRSSGGGNAGETVSDVRRIEDALSTAVNRPIIRRQSWFD